MSRPKTLTQPGSASQTFEMIKLLRKHGPMTALQLAKRMKVDRVWITNTCRRVRGAKRYGLYVYGLSHDRISGSPCNIMAVDEALYAAYMAKVEAAITAPTKRASRASKDEKYIVGKPFPQPATKWHTAWQPSSPYYKAAE